METDFSNKYINNSKFYCVAFNRCTAFYHDNDTVRHEITDRGIFDLKKNGNIV